MSLIDTVKEWTTSFDEFVDFILVSLDNDLVMGLIDQLQDHPSINRIVISKKTIEDTKGTGHGGESLFLTKYPGKVISTVTYQEDLHPCIFFGDFVNSNMMTNQNHDFHKDVELQRKYRNNCRGVLMYKLNGTPPLNGFWQFEKSFLNDNGRFVFLKRSVWAEMIQSIPIIEYDNSDENRINITSDVNVSVKWINCLKKFIAHVVPYFLGTSKLTDFYLSDESMIVWVRSLIHPSYNRIYGYEALEKLGDVLMKAMFNIYMCSKYKRITHTELSEYSNEYMSKHHQWYLSDDLRLKEFILGDMNIIKHTKKTKTDLIESFVGAFFEISQRMNASFGYISTQNLMTLIGEQFSFHKRMAFGMPKPRILSTISAFGFSTKDDFKVDFIQNNQQNSSCVLALSPRFKQFIFDHKNDNDLTKLIGLKIDFIPSKRPKADVENDLFDKIDNIFIKARVDIRSATKKPDKVLSSIPTRDNQLYIRFKEKLSQQFPGYPVEKLIDRVSFNSLTDDEGNNYIIMAFMTFEAASSSLMMRSFTKFVDSHQKAGDDYVEEVDIPMQIKNLAGVPTPADREVGTVFQDLTPYDLGCYYCVLKYVNM